MPLFFEWLVLTLLNLYVCIITQLFDLATLKLSLDPWLRNLENLLILPFSFSSLSGMATTPVFLPGESPWTEILVGYSPWGHKESDMTEWLIWTELMLCLVAQSCPTLYDPMDCSPPGSLSMGILQVRILEWVAIRTPWSRDWIQVSRIASGFCIIWATREAQEYWSG